jgi:hypothetical protein
MRFVIRTRDDVADFFGRQPMTAELSYPALLRGTGTGWAQGMVRIGTIIGLFFFPPLLAWIGLSSLMLALALVPLTGLLSMRLVRWEPVGSRIEELIESGAIPGATPTT